jgi:hypothetical protein
MEFPGEPIFEWFGEAPDVYEPERQLPDGTVIPEVAGDDPRQPGYNTNRT